MNTCCGVWRWIYSIWRNCDTFQAFVLFETLSTSQQLTRLTLCHDSYGMLAWWSLNIFKSLSRRWLFWYFNRWVLHVLTRSLNIIFVNFVSLLRSIREWPTLNVKRSGRGDRAPLPLFVNTHAPCYYVTARSPFCRPCVLRDVDDWTARILIRRVFTVEFM